MGRDSCAYEHAIVSSGICQIWHWLYVLDECYNSESGDCDDEHCQGCYGLEGDNFNGSTANVAKNKKSVLLNGLSGAKTFVLTDESQKVYLHFIL